MQTSITRYELFTSIAAGLISVVIFAAPMLLEDAVTPNGVSLTNCATTASAAYSFAVTASNQLHAAIVSTGLLCAATNKWLADVAQRLRIDSIDALNNRYTFADLFNTNRLIYGLWGTNNWWELWDFIVESNGWVHENGTQVIYLIDPETGRAERWRYEDGEEELVGEGTITFSEHFPLYFEESTQEYRFFDPTPSYGILNKVDLYLVDKIAVTSNSLVEATSNLASSVKSELNDRIDSMTNDLWRARKVFVAGYSGTVFPNMDSYSYLTYDQYPPVGTNVFLGMDYALMLATNMFTAEAQWWTNFYYKIYIRHGNAGNEAGPIYEFEFSPSVATTLVSSARAYLMGSFRTNLVLPVQPPSVYPVPRIYQAAVTLVSRAYGATNVTFVQRTYWLEP